ncbi:cupin domain-containing protein [Sphingomonas sp.]|uniref:cupin domain-containing protein n=1 Tax=Sphingomonas sp. TaxID=28214 RepID=UPI0025E899FC|nr:cupin domain-containing protein [Sphingomonas sp.]
MKFAELLGAGALSTNLIFVHRGVIAPKSGIGEHFHHQCEEMFVILDGDAEFTIDGHTSLVPGPAAVPDRMGHAHGLYNPGDRPLQWLNINVGTTKSYDAFNLDDPRVGVARDPIPQFVSVRLDRSLLRPAPTMNGGRGTMLYRRVLEPSVFNTTWSFVDHLVLPAGSATGRNADPGMSEVYYVISGQGEIDVDGETAPIRAGDAAPVDLGQAHAIRQSGEAPLELMVIGVAKDLAAKATYAAQAAAARQRR